MKIIISYPPLDRLEGCPTLGQNRQFQYFKEPTFIYPVVPAQAATLLKQSGHDVIWNDCIAEDISYKGFTGIIHEQSPDLIAFETKTPVIKEHWKIINQLKIRNPKLKIVLFGDHVTALPEESFRNSQVDYVLTGGDYDFLLLNLCNILEKLGSRGCDTGGIDFEPGIYYRDNGQIGNSGKFTLKHDLDSLPFIDRDLTKWQLYAYKNGNYKCIPGTYLMSGRDCWYHQCTFCSWTSLYPQFRTRSVDNVLNEVDSLVRIYNLREIMDDTGCFPVGGWLKDFCNGMVNRGLNKKLYFDCNMRFGALSYDEFRLMKKANFRLLLFGLESANQATLDRVNKNLKAERIIEDCKAASRAGLFPHITIMFGYPWENYDDALKTLKLGKWLLKKGYAYTMQATLVVPYPGTGLFKECKEKNLLRTEDWEGYDMKQLVMNTSIPDDLLAGLVRDMYKIPFQPEFILRRLLMLKDIDDLRYVLRGVKKVFGHIFDFSNSSNLRRYTQCQ